MDLSPRLQAVPRFVRRRDGRPGPDRYPPAPDPHSRRGALTVRVPIRDDVAEQALDKLLRFYGVDVDSRDDLPFPVFDELHFARFVILPSDGIGPSHLMYSANVDGRPESHLYQLVHRAPALASFYAHCVGSDPTWGPTELYDYLLRHRQKTRLLYEGSPGRAAKQIAAEESLRQAICDLVEGRQAVGGWNDTTALQIVEHVRAEVRSRAELPQGPAPRRMRKQLVGFYVSKVGQFTLVVFGPPVALAGLGLSVGRALGNAKRVQAALAGVGAYVAALGVSALILRRSERTDLVEPIEQVWDQQGDVQDVANLEDHQVQNQLSMRLAIKPTLFRLPLLRVVLRVGNFLTRYYYSKGELSGIPTIHFARFLIDKDSGRMIFFSNYDGNWEEYLGDFLGKGAFAVVPIWTNCDGCAMTRFLFWPSADFGSLFRAYIRRHQMPTQIWYSAYRDLSLVNINDNTRMRSELWSVADERSAQSWLDGLAR